MAVPGPRERNRSSGGCFDQRLSAESKLRFSVRLDEFGSQYFVLNMLTRRLEKDSQNPEGLKCHAMTIHGSRRQEGQFLELTAEKAFRCQSCRKKYARFDLSQKYLIDSCWWYQKHQQSNKRRRPAAVRSTTWRTTSAGQSIGRCGAESDQGDVRPKNARASSVSCCAESALEGDGWRHGGARSASDGYGQKCRVCLAVEKTRPVNECSHSSQQRTQNADPKQFGSKVPRKR